MFLHTENMVSFNLSLQPANFGSQFWLARLSPHFGDESPIFLGFGWCNRFFSRWTIWTTPQVLLGQNVLNLHFYCLGPLKSPVFRTVTSAIWGWGHGAADGAAAGDDQHQRTAAEILQRSHFGRGTEGPSRLRCWKGEEPLADGWCWKMLILGDFGRFFCKSG